jgi:hypothetical protein
MPLFLLLSLPRPLHASRPEDSVFVAALDCLQQRNSDRVYQWQFTCVKCNIYNQLLTGITITHCY